MAEFGSVVEQNRDAFIETRFKLGVGVDIKDVYADAELGRQRQQRSLHVVAEMTIDPRNQRQAGQITRLCARTAP